VQKENETVQKFSHRVDVASDEFFLAMDAQEEPNFMAIIANPGWAKVCANELAKAVI